MAGARTAGLDIGTSAVRAAEITVTGGGLRLERFGQVALPLGAVRDGEIADPEVVTAAVKQLWARGKFKTKRVAIGIANKRVVVRQVELPWLPRDEMRTALRFQVGDFLPMSVDEAVLDYHPLEEFVGDAGSRMVRGMLVAADAGMVTRAISVARRAGLHVDVVDLTSFALLRSVTALHGAVAATTEAIVDIGAAVTNIVVHSGGRPRFVRILMLGGADITDSVSEQLGVDVEAAESLKRSVTMRAPDSGPAEALEPGMRAVEYSGAAFIDEVRGSLDYYRAQPGALPLARIVVSGGGSRLGNLAERLGAATRLPVDIGSGVRSLDFSRTRLSDEQVAEVDSVAVVPVGLAMRMAA